ncbi:hypothetical protein BGAL_0320g00050 [Botrytis galanthina]|uniref:Uncharacterized protein n=1 Tax=Botrytis galanthina TaxID=278940 RepID=A0A4S8QUU3_9HELO|nr:hypothetical protein BGAL_0320g00050 [Botrytis galanthina]
MKRFSNTIASPSIILFLTSIEHRIELCEPPCLSYPYTRNSSRERFNTLCVSFSNPAIATVSADPTGLIDNYAKNVKADTADMPLGRNVALYLTQNYAYPDTVAGGGVYITGYERS